MCNTSFVRALDLTYLDTHFFFPGEYPDGVVADDDQERQYGDDYTDDVAGGVRGPGGDGDGAGDDDQFLRDSPNEPPRDDMWDDGVDDGVEQEV